MNGWAHSLELAGVLFVVGVIVLSVRAPRRNRRRRKVLPAPSDACRRPGVESVP